MDQTLEDLLETRRREGEKISDMIETRCDLSLQQVHRLREIIPEIIASTSDRHVARVREIGIELDNGRLEQEISLLSQKLDVAEELDRLETHTLEVKRVLHGCRTCRQTPGFPHAGNEPGSEHAGF